MVVIVLLVGYLAPSPGKKPCFVFIYVSAPTIVQNGQNLSLKIGTLNANAQWEILDDVPALLYFGVYSSGDATPQTTVSIDWGDGNVDTSELRQVGVQFGYSHQYSQIGDYTIVVQATNTSGQKSAPQQGATVDVRVLPPVQPVVGNSYRWSGLALEKQTLTSQAIPEIQSSEVDIVTLAVVANAGDNYISVTESNVALPSDQITIAEPGKLFTSARVIRVDTDRIILDAELSDSYTLKATVEVKSTNFIRSFIQNPTFGEDWNYPSSHDIDLVRASIRMILNTRFQERVMLPGFGSRLHEIPFDQNDFVVDSLIKRYTADAIAKWEPRATVAGFAITRNQNDVNIRLVCTLTNDAQSVFDVNYSLTL